MTSKILTCTLAASYWRPGFGCLATLKDTGADVGFTRLEVSGTEDDFRAAIESIRKLYATVEGRERLSCTRALKRLEATVKYA